MIVYDLTKYGYRVFDTERPDETIAVLDDLDMTCVLMGDPAGSSKYTEEDTRQSLAIANEYARRTRRHCTSRVIRG